MLTLSFLRETLKNKNYDILADDQIVESTKGLDEIIGIIQDKCVSPIVILENSDTDALSSFMKPQQTLWLMKQIPDGESRQNTQKQILAKVRSILSVFMANNVELANWEWDLIPCELRDIGDFTGYEFTMFYSEE